MLPKHYVEEWSIAHAQQLSLHYLLGMCKHDISITQVSNQHHFRYETKVPLFIDEIAFIGVSEK